MMKRRRFCILFGVLVVVTLLNSTSRAEDFFVNLEQLVEMDATRSMPAYKLDRVLVPSDATPDAEMPWKTFDVFIRFTDFGSVRLDSSGQFAPSSGKDWPKDFANNYGLANLSDVKVARIKNSPDLFIVAWVVEPDALGTAQHYFHGFAVVQLRDRRVAALLRGRCSINAKVRGGIQDGVVDYSRFSFDAKDGILREQLTRDYETWGRDSDPHLALARPEKDEEGEVHFVARIRETITLDYKFADGKLRPWKSRLVYHAKKHDPLHEVARFYLGPFAPRRVLLEENANLAMKFKDNPPGEFIDLDEGTEIRVPVPEKWLFDQFGRTNADSIE